MNISTKSAVVHTHNVTADEKTRDGGRSLLLELFDDLRSDKRQGKLTANFGVGGSIASLQFEEIEKIAQSEIELAPSPVIKINL